MTIFNFLINRPDRPILMKKVRESCVYPILNEIHNIGHIHNTNFAQTQFSTSHPQKTRFLKKRHFTFFWKYLVCGFKIEISEYPTKVVIITYTPYKYEVNRTKTHEIRAKSLCAFLFPLTVAYNFSLIKWAEIYVQYTSITHYGRPNQASPTSLKTSFSSRLKNGRS